MSQSLSELTGQMNSEIVATVPTLVGEVMTREVISLAPQHSFREAIALVARHRFRHLLVVDAEGRPAGVVSDRDLLRFMIREQHQDTATVADVMKADPVTVRPDASLAVASAEMLTRRINCLPVVDEGGRVCGILTSTDLLKAFQHVQEWIEKAGKVSQ